MKLHRYGLMLQYTLIITLVSMYAIGTINYIRTDQPEGSDFRWFYCVGKVYRLNGPDQVYNLDLARKCQAQVANSPVGEERLLLPNHPPFVFPIIALFSNLNYRTAYYLYMGISLLLLFPAMTTVFITLRSLGWNLSNSLVVIIGLITFQPFFVSIVKGQDTYILYMGGVFLFTGWVLKKDWLAGIGLGLALVRPQITLMIALPVIFQRKNIWWWFIATAIVLVGYSVIQIGEQGMKDYLDVLILSTGSKEHGWDEIEMYNLVGLLIRSFPSLDLDIIHAIGWGFYGITIISLCLVSKFSRQIKNWHLSLLICSSLFFAPHLHYHDLALLAVPILGLMIAVVKKFHVSANLVVSFLVLLSFLMLFAAIFPPTTYIFPYLVMAVVLLVSYRMERNNRKNLKSKVLQ